MADLKRTKKPDWHCLGKKEKAAYKRAYLIREAANPDNTLQERNAAIKCLRSKANYHGGNKELKPTGLWNPNVKTYGSGGSQAGHQITRYHVHH